MYEYWRGPCYGPQSPRRRTGLSAARLQIRLTDCQNGEFSSLTWEQFLSPGLISPPSKSLVGGAATAVKQGIIKEC